MLVPAACLAAALSACGGGGGGGSATAAAEPVAISAANASTVAGQAYGAVSGLEGTGGADIVNTLTGAVVQTDAPRIDVIDVIVSQVRNINPELIAGQVPVVTGAVVTDGGPCTNGGSISISLNDLNNDLQLSTGESVTMTFSACNEGGFVMNGSFSINNVTITGDVFNSVPPYSLQLTVQANGFTATENGQAVGMNGGLTLSQSTPDGLSFTSSISGSSLQLTESGITVTMTNFQINATHDDGTGAYTFDADATVSSSTMGGSVTIVTDVPFQGIEPGDPSVGELTVTGANGTSVRLIALDPVNVRLQIDFDGNPGVDSTVDTTWAAL
jgi:hypothetical protein